MRTGLEIDALTLTQSKKLDAPRTDYSIRKIFHTENNNDAYISTCLDKNTHIFFVTLANITAFIFECKKVFTI